MFSRPEISNSAKGSRLSMLVLTSVLAAMLCLALGAVASAEELASEPAGALSSGTTAASGAVIASDKADYAPGERVVLSGAGFQPGETVHIYVQDDEGQTWQRSVEVTADDAGGVVDEFDLPNWFVATYSVVATGAESGVTTTSFTDSNFAVKNASTTPDDATVTYRLERFAANACSGSAAVTQNFTITGKNASLVTPLATNTIQVDRSQATRITYVSATGLNGSYSFDKWHWYNQGPGTAGDGDAYATTPVVCITNSNNGEDNRTFVGFIKSAQQTQSITFTAPSSKTYGDADVPLGATASSALPVSYSSSTPAVCSVVSGAARIEGVGTCTITASQAGTAAFLPAPSVDRSFQVAARTVTGAFTAPDRQYDGTADSTIDSRSLTGAVAGDDVSLTGGAASFGSAAADTGKTVTGTGFSLTGADAGNYALASSTLTDTSAITPKGLTSSFTASDKEYDGTDAATIASRSLGEGAIEGDDVALEDGSASFTSKAVGTDKVVNGSGFSLSGDDAGNYSLTQPASTTASITPIDLTSSFTAANKVYNGSKTAGIASSGLGEGVLDGDDVSLVDGVAAFDSPGVGDDKPVRGSDFSLDGADAANYRVSQPADSSADITPKGLSSSFTAGDKEYDGTTGATISGSQLGAGVLEGDDVSLVDGSASFEDANVGVDKPVAGSGFSLSGDDAGNYSLSQPADSSADITAKPLTSSFTAADKEYDGTTGATISGSQLGDGVIEGDDVSLADGTAAFRTAGAGDDKPVDGTGFSLTGDDAGNYSVSQPAATTADINQATLAVNAGSASKDYGDPNPTPSHTLSGFKGDDTASVVSGSPVCSVDSDAGPTPGVFPGATSCQPGTLSADNYAFESGSTGTFTINKVSTTLVYGGDSSEQYSDVTDLSATLTHNGDPVAGKQITFTIGTQSVSATTNASGVASTTLKLTQAPAVTTVRSVLAEDALYAGSSDSQAFTIRTEDATTTYTGGVFVPTSSPTSSIASVLLSTTVTDAADGSRGDIRNARVEFFDRTSGATLCSAAVGLVNSGDTTVGSAGCEWKASAGSTDSTSYTVGTRVKNYYARDDSSENAVVTVSKMLSSGFITGGGFFVNGTGTAGQVAATVGRKTNFGFNVKYNKSGTNLQGSINTIIRSGTRTFQVKGNAMTSLTSNSTLRPATATFEGKSSIQDITDPLASVPVVDGGGAILRVTMKDYGEPGTADMIGITVWTNKGALWYSSLWGQGKTVEQLLGGGNVVVR